jgi:curved DNA-binding protein CbpA
VGPDRDAYRILQVDPLAEDFVIRAAYHALARRYHPDGLTPDPERMREVNSAFEQLSDDARRQQYDRRRAYAIPIVPTQPQSRASVFSVASGQSPATTVIDFGRYAGWKLGDLLRHDSDYLRWLARHSSGIRYRSAIKQLLPREDFDRPASAVG